MPAGAARPDTSPSPKVTLARETDVLAWCHKLHCTATQLHRAVKAVGTNPSQVAAHLQRKYGAPMAR